MAENAPLVPQNKSRYYDKAKPFDQRDIQMVLLHLTGHFTAKDLAKRFGTTEVVVQRRLRDPQAEALRVEAREKIRENLQKEVVEEIPRLVELAVKALKRTLEVDISPFHKAKANQDKVALAVAVGSGLLKPENAEEAGSRGLKLTPEQHKDIVVALEKSAKAREIKVVPFTESEVVSSEVKNGRE